MPGAQTCRTACNDERSSGSHFISVAWLLLGSCRQRSYQNILKQATASDKILTKYLKMVLEPREDLLKYNLTIEILEPTLSADVCHVF